MPAAEPIGTRIAKRRHQLDLSQEELAGLIGVHRDSVSKWESGRHYPHRHLGKLEAALGISLTEELNGADVYTDPDEARIWSWTVFTVDERRAMIDGLRAARGKRATA